MKTTNFNRFTITLLAIVYCQLSVAGNTKPHGWRWYNEPKPTQSNKQPESTEPRVNTMTRTLSATEQLQWFKQEYEEVKAAAIIDADNPVKAEKLMRYNKFVSDKSSDFGKTFLKVLTATPDLNYIKDRPIESAIRPDFLKAKTAKYEKTVKKLADEGWGFFLVYEGNDPMMNKYGASIQSFSDRYGIEVLGVSMDGLFDKGIRDNKNNDGQLNVQYVPALILVNPSTNETKPVNFGYISQDKLLQRTHYVATDFTDMDF